MKTLKAMVSGYEAPTISLIVLEETDVVRTSNPSAENGAPWGSGWDQFE